VLAKASSTSAFSQNTQATLEEEFVAVFCAVHDVSNTQYVVKEKSKVTLTLTLNQRGQRIK
jgi:hypothetical protein